MTHKEARESLRETARWAHDMMRRFDAANNSRRSCEAARHCERIRDVILLIEREERG